MAAGIRVDVRSDLHRAVAEFRKLEDAALDKATYRAINRALDAAATGTSREIRQEYNIRHRAVMAALKKRRASSKSLFARLTIEGARIGLIEFDARHSRRQAGASVKIKTAGARKIVQGAFIATRRWRGWRLGTGGMTFSVGAADQAHTGVFRRVGRARYPIRYLRSVSIPQAFASKAVLEAIQRLTHDAFVKNYEQQLRFLSGVTRG